MGSPGAPYLPGGMHPLARPFDARHLVDEWTLADSGSVLSVAPAVNASGQLTFTVDTVGAAVNTLAGAAKLHIPTKDVFGRALTASELWYLVEFIEIITSPSLASGVWFAVGVVEGTVASPTRHVIAGPRWAASPGPEPIAIYDSGLVTGTQLGNDADHVLARAGGYNDAAGSGNARHSADLVDLTAANAETRALSWTCAPDHIVLAIGRSATGGSAEPVVRGLACSARGAASPPTTSTTCSKPRAPTPASPSASVCSLRAEAGPDTE